MDNKDDKTTVAQTTTPKGSTDNNTDKTVDVIIDEVKKEIKIDSKKTYSTEEVNNLINDAIKKGANISKNQFQNNITSLKEKVNTFEAEKAELLKQLESKSKVETEKVTEEKNELEKKLAEINEQAKINSEKLKVMEDEAVRAITEVTELQKSLAKERLDKQKAELIAEAKGKIIAELVTGDTVEELKASATLAKKKYDELHTQLRKELGIPTETEKKDGNKEVVINPIKSVKDTLSISEWEKVSKEIKDRVYRNNGFNI